tara:strand:- start:652 stop:1233 length:582 start_codon:yes stop_codon:yes gene_type:complete
MQGLYNFIVKPKGDIYNNTKKIAGVDLILNNNLSEFKYINRKAIVLALPKMIQTDIKVGDEIIIHHNVFRIWYDLKGKQRNSASYIKKNLYTVSQDQIYLHKVGKNWLAYKGFTFVKPILNKDKFNLGIEHASKGIVKYTDGTFNKEQLVGFNPRVNHEFIIDNELLYKIPNVNIEIIYEYQGDEEAYNPSWA